jgi:hypothetical protein
VEEVAGFHARADGGGARKCGEAAWEREVEGVGRGGGGTARGGGRKEEVVVGGEAVRAVGGHVGDGRWSRGRGERGVEVACVEGRCGGERGSHAQGFGEGMSGECAQEGRGVG